MPIPLADRHGVIRSYEVQYMQIDSDSTSHRLSGVTTVPGMNLSVLLTGLDTFRLYSVRVRGFTSVGPGPQSDPPVIVRTLTGCEWAYVHILYNELSDTVGFVSEVSPMSLKLL